MANRHLTAKLADSEGPDDGTGAKKMIEIFHPFILI